MSKEIYISSTPHETRLAVVENDQLAEIYYERENEYTLAGSIYNGKVTRVLPGMQSSFVDIGLERDAFLYVTDFMEEAVDPNEFDTSPANANGGGARPERSGNDRGDRGGRGGRDRGRDRNREPRSDNADAPLEEGAVAADGEGSAEKIGEGAPGADGSRRWRGRRGRRRGRGGDRPAGERSTAPQDENTSEPDFEHHADGVPVDSADENLENGFDAAPDVQVEQPRSDNRNDGGRNNDRGRREGRGGRDRDRGRGREDRGPRTPREDRGPIENAYGDTQFAAKPAEPLILPGESLSRYKPGNDAQSGTANIEASVPAAKPSNIIEAPLKGWDGGAVLPGESRAVRGSGGRSEAPRRDDNRGPREDRGGRDRNDRNRGGRGDSRNDGGRGDGRNVGRRPEYEQVAAPLTPERTHEIHTEDAPVVEATHVEYEPEEASASYRVDPGAPSEYRHSVEDAPVLEAVEEESFEEVAERVEAQPAHLAEPVELIHGVHEYTTLQPGGEMLDQGTMAHLTEIDPVKAAHSVPYTASAGEVAPAVEEAEIHEPVDPMAFAPGTGELEEEIIEEEEFESGSFAIHAEDDDLEEIEEETVEGAEALGAILRDMSIDEMTSAEPEEDLEGGFAESEEESYEEGGDDSAEFAADEENSTEVTADGAAPQQERRGRRDGRRGGRGHNDGAGRRDGRRGRGGPGRGGRSHAPSAPIPIISDLLKPGQEILVQIAKEPIAKKGARITSHIALPGRFLVFMPTVNHIGVSRKISSDEERRRLKQILLSEKGEATGGFIVRTAADNASEEELRADLRFLINLWAGIKERSESSKSPALIYHDLNLVERILRDQVTDNFSAIWVDSEPEYERVLRFLQRFQPNLIKRVKLYTKETPLFEQFGITEEINKALRSKVWLKSGGSIVINQTEALVAIDINTGKYVGKTARLEDTILKTNLDAIPEIVRQVRLRDLGGIIVIDFIDMDERKNRNKVMQALEDELKNDRAPSKVLQFNDFGLVAITRKRVKQSLERTLSTTCTVCQGTGMVKSPVTVCNDIFIEMRKMHRHLERGDIMLRVHPEVVKQLKSNGAKWLSEMEEMAGKTILVKSDPTLHPEQFDIH
ncbi:MAG TPA: Rne/Rng family ribonuclease [Acidobacteriaceae bacterium]|nr:Rne/Rng family ribonuclease [Acidobacteriaceae bacterium]